MEPLRVRPVISSNLLRGNAMRRLVNILGLAMLLIHCASANADVYFYEDEKGALHYSDSADDPRYQLFMVEEKPFSIQFGGTIPVARGHRGYELEIAEVARTTKVEAALLHAVISVESNYNPRAVSRKGALGLMQLMPATAREYGVKNPMDAVQNITGGAQYLRKLLDHFSDNKSLALAAYNAGLGAVINHGSQIPRILETQSYVPEVLRRYASNQRYSVDQSGLTDKQ
jgi:hypothetical protein